MPANVVSACTSGHVIYDQPISLQESCTDFITDHLESLCEVQTNVDTNLSKLTFRQHEIFFHNNIGDAIFNKLSAKQKLDDKTLSLFDPRTVLLKHVHLQSDCVSTKGLRVLKSHKLIGVDAVGLQEISVNELIGCLGEWTLANLRSLNVSRTTFTNSAKFCVFVSLSRLKHLLCLNVSSTGFNRHGLEMIVEDLPNLQSLDISSTPVTEILALRKCKNRLKYLSMYNVRVANNSESAAVLGEMKALQHLDISDELSDTNSVSPFPHEKIKMDRLMRSKMLLPNIRSLDISAKLDVTEESLRIFVDNHENLSFLGLSLTSLCEMTIFCPQMSSTGPSDSEMESERDPLPVYSDIKISGEATDSQIKEALLRYVDRPSYIHKSLYNLFNLTKDSMEPHRDLLDLILPCMRKHASNLGLQMAATACIYNLTKGHLGQQIHPACLQQVVKLTLCAMEAFPTHKQLQKNGLLTMCSDRILQDVTFDKFCCIKLVLESLCRFDDPSMTRMSVAISSILAAKIPTNETAQIGANIKFMKKLLNLVRQKTATLQVDVIMKFTLSALWNLTDESASTSRVFIREGGLTLFIMTLKAFEYSDLATELKIQVETKCLGLLNNIAEVKQLKCEMMNDEFLAVLLKLVASDKIEVSYFASGIMVHLLIEEPLWKPLNTKRHLVDVAVTEAITKWEKPKSEMVAYRSFHPFLALLRYSELAVVALWAVWAIHHVCSINKKRYCPMLKEEGCYDIMTNLHVQATSLRHEGDGHGYITKIIQSVLDLY